MNSPFATPQKKATATTEEARQPFEEAGNTELVNAIVEESPQKQMP